MTTHGLNLIEDAWLPVTTLDGATKQLSIRDLLVHAHDLAALTTASPLQTVALLRLLVAVHYASLGHAQTSADQAALLAAGRFDTARIDDYAAAWAHRFELLSADRPFLQAAEDMDDIPASSIARLVAELASGNNATLFDHSLDAAPPALTMSNAATALIAHQAFALGGGVSKPFNFTDSPLCRGASLIPMGESLFTTLALMAIPYDKASPVFRPGNPASDRPTWELDVPVPDREGNTPRGYLNYIVWMARRIRLIADDDGLMRTCRYQQGLRLPGQLLDPFMGYRRDDKSGRMLVRRVDPARALWRDSPALVEEQIAGDRAASLLSSILQLDGDIDVPPYRIEVVGLVTSQAKVQSSHHERLPFGKAFVARAALRDIARNALTVADEAYGALLSGLRICAAQLLAPGSAGDGRQADKDDVSRLVMSFGADADYWPRLEAPFRQLCSNAESGGDLEELRSAWHAEVRRCASGVFGRVERSAAQRSRGDAAAAHGARVFAIALAKAVPVTKEEVTVS